MTHLASGLLQRGHAVHPVLRGLVCDFPDGVPTEVRLFFLFRFEDKSRRSNLEQLRVTQRPLLPIPLPMRLRFPQIYLGLKLHWKQRPLLTSTKLPLRAAATAAYFVWEQPDAILSVLVPAVVAATMAACLVPRPVRIVVTGHDVPGLGRLLRRARRSFPYTDAVVCISRAATSEPVSVSGLPDERIHIVYNPVVPADLPRKAREPAGHPWLDEPACPGTLAIGRLTKVKDFATLLTAFARLLDRHPARLIVLGESPLRRRLLSLARKLQVSEHVDFPVFAKNLYAFLARASLFTLSSRYESLSNGLIEAMACGCPVVDTDCSVEPREILEDVRLGEHVPVGDADAFANAMVNTLNEPPRPDMLRERETHFGTERALERREQILFEQ